MSLSTRPRRAPNASAALLAVPRLVTEKSLGAANPWPLPALSLIGLLAALVLACAPPPRPERPVVLVSVPPQAWCVEALAGDWVDVFVLVPPGASPAHHEPGVATMRALTVASLWFKVGHPGFPFEATWLDRLLAENEALLVVDMAAGSEPPAGAGERLGDPHLWLSPAVTADACRRLAGALIRLLPERAMAIAERRQKLLARIETVDDQLARLLAPFHGRSFLVFHPAWGWFAEHFGLHQIAIEHDHKPPSPDHLAASIERAREADCRVVFVQPQFSRAAARQVAEALQASVVTLDPLAGDWDSNLLRTAEALAAGLARS